MKQRSEVECLYERHADRLYRFCFRLCGNESDAEDLAAETFLVALRRTDVNLAMLFGIALNKWRMQVRMRAIRQRLNSVLTLRKEPRLDESMELDSAIDGLPTALREAFILVKVEGFTHLEAAVLLGKPLGTVQARVFKACHRLRALLSESPQDMGPAFRPVEENLT